MRYLELLQAELKKDTLRSVARKIGISPSHLVLMRDTHAKPRKHTLDKLVRYFHRPPQDLLAGHELTEEIIARVRRLDDQEKRHLLRYLQGTLQ